VEKKIFCRFKGPTVHVDVGEKGWPVGPNRKWFGSFPQGFTLGWDNVGPVAQKRRNSDRILIQFANYWSCKPDFVAMFIKARPHKRARPKHI
jgi:hypothetical protein